MTLFYRNVKDWQLRKCSCFSFKVNSALKQIMSILELYAGELPSAYHECVLLKLNLWYPIQSDFLFFLSQWSMRFPLSFFSSLVWNLQGMNLCEFQMGLSLDVDRKLYLIHCLFFCLKGAYCLWVCKYPGFLFFMFSC